MSPVQDYSGSLGTSADSDVPVPSEAQSLSNIVPFTATKDEEYLCYFYHRHLDFRIQEVESLAEMAGGTPRIPSTWWRQRCPCVSKGRPLLHDSSIPSTEIPFG